MKLQRSTGILLGVAIALAAAVALFETQKDTTESSDTLYSFAETDVSAFTIEQDDSTLAFEKADDIWQMTEPETAAADPSTIAFLLNIVTTSAIQDTITASPDELDTYGLDTPTATVQLTVDDADYTLTVGDEDFSGSSLYVMTIDSDTDIVPSEVHIIANEFTNGIDRPLDDWILDDSENAEDESTNDENGNPNSEITEDENTNDDSED